MEIKLSSQTIEGELEYFNNLFAIIERPTSEFMQETALILCFLLNFQRDMTARRRFVERKEVDLIEARYHTSYFSTKQGLTNSDSRREPDKESESKFLARFSRLDE